MKIINRTDVEAALRDQELEVLQVVHQAYMLHSAGETALPLSSFLRPIGHPNDRIIALPAYLGGHHPVAGLKWISSFPGNLDRGLQRASSVLVLNDMQTGYARAVLESSRISTWRTAASAALASHVLHAGRTVEVIGVLGCGTINLKTLDFLLCVHPEVRRVVAYDAVGHRAGAFADVVRQQHRQVEVSTAVSPQALIELGDTVSIATTDSRYWLRLPPADPTGRQVILHTSLRDIDPDSIIDATNVVDDPDHVCREATSLALAEERTGNRDFIAASLGDLLLDGEAPAADSGRIVFSPFGLGVLDLAVASHVMARVERLGLGLEVPGFDPGEHPTAMPTSGTSAGIDQRDASASPTHQIPTHAIEENTHA